MMHARRCRDVQAPTHKTPASFDWRPGQSILGCAEAGRMKTMKHLIAAVMGCGLLGLAEQAEAFFDHNGWQQLMLSGMDAH